MYGMHCRKWSVRYIGLIGVFVLISTVSPSYASEEVGVITKLFALELRPLDYIVVVLACAATLLIASYEFSRGEVTVLNFPTMPKYTVSQRTYQYFSAFYTAVVIFLLVVVMEYYTSLRQLLISISGEFDKLPSGDNVLLISIGSVAVVGALHYLRIPNSEIGPSWFLFRFRRFLHRRARIPDEAEALANLFLSNDKDVFEVPAKAVNAVCENEDVRLVDKGDFTADHNSPNYQWAIISYLYMIGLDRENTPPYSSFSSNQASQWSRTKKAYRDLAPAIEAVKQGDATPENEKIIRENLKKLRSDLSIFHACMHLFAVKNDPDRISELQEIGLKQSAVFFVFDRTLIAKTLIFIAAGIAGPPLLLGMAAKVLAFPAFQAFAEPGRIMIWMAIGLPMYAMPIVLVMLLKQFMTTSWPIRLIVDENEEDEEKRQRATFKYDIYVMIFALSYVLGSVPLLAFEKLYGLPVSTLWALPPSLTAVTLAVLIDLDVVQNGGTAGQRNYPRWVLVVRAVGLGALLGFVIGWLATTIIPATSAQIWTYIGTAFVMGGLIGIHSRFRRNIRTV